MDISSHADYPASALSNFTAHPFVFDGVECASMEGLLQSFKFEDPDEQLAVCALVGIEAKRAGRERDNAWKRVQRLWRQGRAIERNSGQYQELLDRAFNALAGNHEFQQALLDSGVEELTHFAGHDDPTETVLTEREFCSRLERIRTRLLTPNREE